jgi:hypothetical protein
MPLMDRNLFFRHAEREPDEPDGYVHDVVAQTG